MQAERGADARGRRRAYVSLAGTVKGASEDGPAEQKLDGSFYFDLESNQLSYLSCNGIHRLLDRDGKEVGRIEGQFVLTRRGEHRSEGAGRRRR